MAALQLNRIIGGFCALALLVLPSMAAAQSSTFVTPFDRIGDPGTAIVTTVDPLTLEPIEMAVPTGAFVNPCTLENVDVTGTSTISTVQTVDRFGTVKVNVSVRTRGTGVGWTGADYTSAIFSGATYAFDDSQQFTFQLPQSGQEFSSDFSDKLAMKGAKSIDNWVIRAHFRIKVNAAGDVQVFMIKSNADTCKG